MLPILLLIYIYIPCMYTLYRYIYIYMYTPAILKPTYRYILRYSVYLYFFDRALYIPPRQSCKFFSRSAIPLLGFVIFVFYFSIVDAFFFKTFFLHYTYTELREARPSRAIFVHPCITD